MSALRRYPAAALVAVAALVALLATAGCADDAAEPGPAAPSGVRIEITVEGGAIEPQGERVDVEVGEEIELLVQADRAGELHVHTTEEQTLSYDSGTTTLTLTIEQPGVVDVESHDPEQVVVQLEAR